MKALVVDHLGEAGSLIEIPVPKPGPHAILVRFTAAGVNPIDWKQRNRPETKFPLLVGRDHGAYAEYTIVSDDDRTQPIAKIPDAVGDADDVALPTAGP